MSLPPHGRIDCAACFEGQPVVWGVTAIERHGWRIENNPGAWGSTEPLVLILGVSKGTNQCNKINKVQHDEIPFAGERPALSKILARLGLLAVGTDVSSRIGKQEKDFAFGSMIRCSIAMWDAVKQDWLKAGPVVKASATNAKAKHYLSTCTNRFLAELPERTRLVVLLSNDDDYVDACFAAFKTIYPDIQRHSSVTYGNQARTWVHVVHSSGSSGRHIPHWLDRSYGKQADKRDQAIRGVVRSGVVPELRP